MRGKKGGMAGCMRQNGLEKGCELWRDEYLLSVWIMTSLFLSFPATSNALACGQNC